jgi:hypothetical protein
MKTLIEAARTAKMQMMDSLIAMSETDAERTQMEAAKAKLIAMTDSEFMRYHGVAA